MLRNVLLQIYMIYFHHRFIGLGINNKVHEKHQFLFRLGISSLKAGTP